MHVTLDQDQWEVGNDVTMGAVLADVSERAHARARIVTSLVIDQQRITDRDLDPLFLATATTRFTRLTATSQSTADIMQAAEPSIRKYAELVRADGSAVIASLRTGQEDLSSLDAWLGQLADYLELEQAGRPSATATDAPLPLAAWTQELLTARTQGDRVLMADLLEYEILPRLEA